MVRRGGAEGNTGNLQTILYTQDVASEVERSEQAREPPFPRGWSSDQGVRGSDGRRGASCARERIPSFAKMRER